MDIYEFILLSPFSSPPVCSISARVIESTHKIYILNLFTSFHFPGDDSLQSSLPLTPCAVVPQAFFQFLDYSLISFLVSFFFFFSGSAAGLVRYFTSPTRDRT